MKTPVKPAIPTMGANTERPTRVKQHVEDAHAAIEKEPVVRLNVEIPAALHRAVKTKASQEGKTIKEVVLALLIDYSK